MVPVGIPRQHALLMFACSDLLAEWVLGNENACDTCQLLEMLSSTQLNYRKILKAQIFP